MCYNLRMKIKELIAELQKHDPERGVAVLASCCGHAHDIQEVLPELPDPPMGDANSDDEERPVVLRANG
jgi:hypothetical protein